MSTTLTTTFTTTSTSFTDITGLTVSITPTLNTSKILVIVSVSGSHDVGVQNGAVRLARGGTGIFVGTAAGSRTLGQGVESVSAAAQVTLGLSFLDSPATTSATTYKTQFMSQADNQQVIVQTGGGRSTITLMEISA